MTIGVLRVVLGLAKPGQVHYGSDPVDCYAELTYMLNPIRKPGDSTELFGPLKAIAHFEGHTRTKITHTTSNGNGGTRSSTRKSKVQLFNISAVIYDNTLRIQAGRTCRVPFRLRFPTEDSNQEQWEENPMFEHRLGRPLPPSYTFEGRRESGSVEYRVSLAVSMPGIDIRIAGADGKEFERVLFYELPRPTSTIEERNPRPVAGFVNIRSQQLLPEAQRPQGLRQNVKAMLSTSDTPSFHFNWNVIAPTHLYNNQPLIITLLLKPGVCTAPSMPTIEVQNVQVYLNAYVTVRTCNEGLFRTRTWQENGKVPQQTLIGRPYNRQPFGEANGWTKLFQTPHMTNVTSSFRTYNVTLSYKIKVMFTFRFIGKMEQHEAKFDVVVHPPLGEPEAAPLYLEADDSAVPAVASEPVPAGPAPPGYSEATNDVPPYVANTTTTDTAEGGVPDAAPSYAAATTNMDTTEGELVRAVEGIAV